MIEIKSLVLSLFATVLLTSSGCKKAEPTPPPGTMPMLGINVELPRLEQEFQNASPELQNAVQEIKRECRTWQLPKMVVALDSLAKNPSLTESQKKVVSDVMDEAGQVITRQGGPSGR